MLNPELEFVRKKKRRLLTAGPPSLPPNLKHAWEPVRRICALLGAKDHLNIFIYEPIAPGRMEDHG